MADLSLTFTIDENQEISIDFLEDLAERSSLSNVDNASLAAGLIFPRLSAPASPAQGDAVVNASTGRLDFYDSVPTLQSLGLAETISVTNQSGITLVTGDIVVVDPTNAFSCTATYSRFGTPSPHVLGPVADVQGPGNATNVLVRGIGLCKALADKTSPVGSWLAAPASGSESVRAAAVEPEADVLSGFVAGTTFFAITLMETVPAAGVTLTWSLVWR